MNLAGRMRVGYYVIQFLKNTTTTFLLVGIKFIHLIHLNRMKKTPHNTNF